jgi:5-methylcytosine-specific restriction endonuclease McrBC regulatory subunit McrC
MCNFISIEHDYIFVADAFKNFQVFKLKDTEELKKQTQETSDIITLKKRFQSKIDSNCIGVWPFQVLPDSDSHLQHTTVFSCGQDGILRIYGVKSYKNLDMIGQIDIKDHVLDVMPVVDMQTKTRVFYVSTKRSGILKVSTCTAA